MLRLLAGSLLTLSLVGCNGAPSGCLLCGPFADNLDSSLHGLVGYGLVLQNKSVAGFTLNGPSANGASVAFAVVDANTSYDLTVQTQPTNPSQTCVVTNGSGAAGTTNISDIVVTCTTNPPRFVYIANSGSNDVSAFAINAASGALAAIAGSPFASGALPVALAVDAAGQFLYVVPLVRRRRRLRSATSGLVGNPYRLARRGGEPRLPRFGSRCHQSYQSRARRSPDW